MKEFPPFKVDEVNQCLWRIGETGAEDLVDLAPRAFDMLRYMVDHPGRLITHEEFLESLWPGVHVQAEVIKGHILTVRTALGDHAKEPRFIETVRGRGYRFIAGVCSPNPLAGGALPPAAPVRMVGRSGPLTELEQSFKDTLRGQTQLVFVAGESGIGKTTLVDEFLARSAKTPGPVIARGQCVEGFGGTEPYYPVLDALSQLCRTPAADGIKRLLTSLAPTWALQLPGHISVDQRRRLQQDVAGAHRDRMLREICEFLDALSQQQPVILLFEDMHWADCSTVDVLSAMARRRSSARCMIIATYRPEDAGGELHPVKQVSRALLLKTLCREIALGPLSEEAVGEFLSGEDGQASAPDFAGLMRERCSGNPLFMKATLEHLADRGLVDQIDDRWCARTPLAKIDFGVPLTLGQVIEARLQRLTGDELKVLQAASIAGMSFTADVASAVEETPPALFEEICEELSRKGGFISRDDSAPWRLGSHPYVFQHAVYRQMLYERQGPIRKAQGHLRIGRRLETLSSADRQGAAASELAQHFAAAEEWPTALNYLRGALATAKRRVADREALDILDWALSLSAHLPPPQRIAAELEFLQNKASIFSAAHDPRAADIYQTLFAEAKRHGEVDIQARALLGLAYAVGWHDQVRSVKVLDEVLCLSPLQADPQAQARTRMSAHVWRIWVGGWDEEGARHCADMLHFLRKGSDPLVAAWATLEHCMIDMICSRYREACTGVQVNYQILIEGAQTRSEFNFEWLNWIHYLGLPWSLLFAGELGRSLNEFDTSIDLFTRNGNRYAVNTLRLYRAWVLIHSLDFKGALAACRQVVPRYDASPAAEQEDDVLPAERRLCLLLAGFAEQGLGNHRTALSLLSGVERDMASQPVILDWYWRMPLEWELANVWMSLGGLKEAKSHAERFERIAGGTQERTWQGLAWETLARVALLERAYDEAVASIKKAFGVTEKIATPLADWRLQMTAAKVFDAAGFSSVGLVHASAARKSLQDLAASFPYDHSLRRSLLRHLAESDL